MNDFADWIGNTETCEDVVSATAVAGMSALLDRDDPEPQNGDPLPPLWHWMLFAPKARQSELGPDGHPARGGFLPPIALPRRMFAGARYRFHRPLRVGERVRRETRIDDIIRKTGSSGELVFIKLTHSIAGEDGPAIEEQQDIVYRGVSAPAQPAARNDEPPPMPDWQAQVTPDPVLLFRYSALTFNGHRIHYDRTYATQEEGYPGLVVHGPLIATYLTELARTQAADRSISSFRFRAKRALFDTAPFHILGGLKAGGDGFWLQARDHDGHSAMDAEGTFAPQA